MTGNSQIIGDSDIITDGGQGRGSPRSEDDVAGLGSAESQALVISGCQEAVTGQISGGISG